MTCSTDTSRWTSNALNGSTSTPTCRPYRPARRSPRSSPGTWAFRFPPRHCSSSLVTGSAGRCGRMPTRATSPGLPSTSTTTSWRSCARIWPARRPRAAREWQRWGWQEFQRVWTAYQRQTQTGAAQFSFTKADRRVTCYYFCLWYADFGPAFVKVCAYFPYPAKFWLNGHEWVKRQATGAGIGFAELSNGFAACDDPAALQAICDRLGPGHLNVFTQRWLSLLPLPFGQTDRDAGYWWECSMRQIEVSRTLVFDAPRHARGFFEALIADNLDIGRPGNVEIIFGRQIRSTTKGVFRTAIDRHDNKGVVVKVFYKHSRIKQYLKDGRAMRIETVVTAPRDLGCNARLHNLDELQTKARACNRRILDAERVGQGCVLASPAFERIAHPTVDTAGRRTRHFGSAILGSWPWSAPCAPPCWRPPASPTRACAPWLAVCSAPPTATGR